MSTDSDLVLIEELRPGIARLLLNDPDTLNAMSEDMADIFSVAVKQLAGREDLRVVLLSGAGRAFSAGGHLDMLSEKAKQSEEKNRRDMLRFYHHFLSIRDVPVPVIAAVRGAAVGAGLCLALASDVLIAAEDASLGMPFVRLGLHPGMGATYFLPRAVGPARAAELLYSGAVLSGQEAKRIGLVHHCCKPDQLDAFALDYAGGIYGAGPNAVRELKANLQSGQDTVLEACLGREAAAQARDYCGAQFREGLAAARGKRPPDFS